MSERARRLHDSAWQGVVYLTGGGAGFLAELLQTPGASRTLLEASVPYAEAALSELLGGQPDHACSDRSARALGMAAFQRARKLGADPAFGLGLTASLATDRKKRGACRVHLAVQTLNSTWHGEIPLSGDRAACEKATVEHAWTSLGTALALTEAQNARHARQLRRADAQAPWRALIQGSVPYCATEQTASRRLLFPGAFNPLHDAHRQMLTLAEDHVGCPGAYELSVENVDKPLLDYAEIHRRLGQFERPAWLTRLPTFRAKAAAFPGATFIVGMDTLIRIADPDYYGGEARRDQALIEFSASNSRFLVFGRNFGGRFHDLESLPLPATLKSLCTGVREQEFRQDLSSRTLRADQTSGTHGDHRPP